MNQKTALAIIIALVLVFGWVYISINPTVETVAPAPVDIPKEISLRGEFVCLPSRYSTSTVPLECALGIRSDNNVYYVIDAQGDAARNTLLGLQTGLKIQIDGVLVPANQLNSDIWQKYDIGGIISTDRISRIRN